MSRIDILAKQPTISTGKITLAPCGGFRGVNADPEKGKREKHDQVKINFSIMEEPEEILIFAFELIFWKFPESENNVF